MDISFFTNPGDLNTFGGYGVAGLGIVTALQRAGHSVPWNDSRAPVKLNFSFPSVFADYLNPNQHNIYLMVWESTKLQPDWHEIIDEVDEIWTASTWCAKVMAENGYKVSTIYPHGIDPVWRPARRAVRDKVRFLFVGGNGSRKNAQMTFDAFRAAFGVANDVELIMKEKHSSDVRVYSGKNIVGVPEGNVKVITSVLEQEQMIELYNSSHCFVLPTSGEGFGIPARDALGTGIPSITTVECSEYSNFLGDLGLASDYIDSPWPDMHPGKVLKPDFDDLVDKLRHAKDNIETLLPKYYKQSFLVHDAYDWDTLTEQAFSDVIQRFS